MIISHKYKYVFVQLDQTASTAIARELKENYGGKDILWKHARYPDFLAIATPEEKKYFAFAGVRNPLDLIVSEFIKRKTDHLGRFSKGKIGYKQTTRKDLRMYEFIQENNADFEDFFKKFYYRDLYNEWKTIGFDKMDYIYRFENVSEEFGRILKILGIEQKSLLPIVNRTTNRQRNFELYYPRSIQARTKMLFESYMQKWGYKFPEGWEEPTLSDRIFVYYPLYIKFLIKRLIYLIIDIPAIYKKIYRKVL